MKIIAEFPRYKGTDTKAIIDDDGSLIIEQINGMGQIKEIKLQHADAINLMNWFNRNSPFAGDKS
jgi:hypothetical protein